MSVRRIHLAFVISLAISASLNAAEDGEESLKFHVIKNGSAKHISMIPENGYSSSGKIKASFNPNSVVHQHAALLKSLKEEQAELDRQAEEEALAAIEQEQSQGEPSQSPGIIRRVKSEGNIFLGRAANRGVLDELIQLEKRGGRAKDIE